MSTLDEFNKQNRTSVDEDGIIVNPNIIRRNIAENAAKAGVKSVPQASREQKKVDLVNDLGLKSERQVREEEALENDDIYQALGPQLENAAERKKNEMNQFIDSLEQCGGEMTEEDLSMLTEQPNYEEMLLSPPDPLNSELKKYTEEQKRKFMETASDEELMARGLYNREDTKIEKLIQENAPVEIDNNMSIENDEDENIIMECDDDCIIPNIPENIEKAINTTQRQEDYYNDEIPYAHEKEDNTVQESLNQQDNTPVEIISIENSGDKIADKVASVNIGALGNIDIDKELENLELDEEDDSDRRNKMKEKIKKASNDIKNKVIPIANRVDISGFAISTKPVSINNSVEMAKAAYVPSSARWALFSSGRPIEMTGMLGTEIDDLVRLSQGSDENFTVSDIYARYGIFYNHTISPKPGTVEEWLKTISIMDIKHLYATGYKASFINTNFLPVDCTNDKCDNGFITDNLPFESLVDYENAEAKTKAMKIYNSNPSIEEYHLYHSELIPISDVYAMSFKEPSIYDVQIGPKYLDSDWANKMQDAISINMYVDSIFVIDPISKTLRPLGIKEFKNDPKKTLKAKVLALAKVLSTLSSDQYSLISSYIEEINNVSNLVNYQFPEVICPECGTKIEARPSSAANLLFTRHRLTALVNG